MSNCTDDVLLEYENLWAFLVPVWIFFGLGIFIYKQTSCFSLPATNTFEGNVNLFIVLLFGVFYIYADSQKMQRFEKHFFITILAFFFIFVLCTSIIILKRQKIGHWWKEIKIWTWVVFYIITIGTTALYVVLFDKFGLITWITLSFIYGILILLIALFRRNSSPNVAFYFSILSMIYVIITVIVEFSFKNICLGGISPKRIIYPILMLILVIINRISKLITGNMENEKNVLFEPLSEA